MRAGGVLGALTSQEKGRRVRVHGLTLEHWAQRTSPIHRLHAITKIAATITLLLSLSLADPAYPVFYLGCFVLLTAGTAVAKLPLGRLLLRSLLVVPFVGGVVVVNLFGGDPARGLTIFWRAYLSACAATLLLATTPFPTLLHALDRLRVPHFFLTVVHFLYRYLSVVYEQAKSMRRARQCRAPQPDRRGLWEVAAATVGSLFLRSHHRAERVHRAMLARGFRGRLMSLETARFAGRDWTFLLVFFALLGLLQFASQAFRPGGFSAL